MLSAAEPRLWKAEYGAEHLLTELEQLAAFTLKAEGLTDKRKALTRMHKQAQSWGLRPRGRRAWAPTSF